MTIPKKAATTDENSAVSLELEVDTSQTEHTTMVVTNNSEPVAAEAAPPLPSVQPSLSIVPPVVPAAEEEIPPPAKLDVRSLASASPQIEVVDVDSIATPAANKSFGTKSISGVKNSASKAEVAAAPKESALKKIFDKSKESIAKISAQTLKLQKNTEKQQKQFQKVTDKVSRFAVSRPVKGFLLSFVLGCSFYGYSVYTVYTAGPYGAWDQIIKHWKKGNVVALQQYMDVNIDSIPLYIIEKFPSLVLSEENEFGPLIKKVYKLRKTAYDQEFKKGYGSRFWEFQIQEMTDYGDHFEVRYENGKEYIVFSLEKEADEWKLAAIEASHSNGIFSISDEDIKGEEL